MARNADQTKQAIKQAFVELIAEKGLDRLSISDIARRSGLNRGTIYLHYTDKYDLLAHLEDEALEDLVGILFAGRGEVATPEDLVPDTSIAEGLRYIQGDAVLFTALTGPGGDPQFAERLKEVVATHLLDEVEHADTFTKRFGDVPTGYVREIALGGIMAIITLWLRRGTAEPVELIAQLIETAKHVAPLDLIG